MKQARIPLMVFPFKAIIHAAVIFVFAFTGFIFYALIVQPKILTLTWLLLPIFWVVAVLLITPLAVISSIMNMRVRDYQQAIGFLNLASGSRAMRPGAKTLCSVRSFMGCDPNAIKLREEEIVRFADLGEFIDLPIRTYSSGMLVRLAFAISSYLDGDILLIDEVFGAGDANFQIKAMARLNSLIEQAKIVILVGHTLETITHFCDRVLWVDRGQIVMDGDRHKVAEAYLATINQ